MLIQNKKVIFMFQNKKTGNSKLRERYGLIFLAVFLFLAFTPVTASAQIITLDPVTAGIQAIIQSLTAANTAIQAAESKIEVELSALKYVRQGEQLMNQIKELQQESSSLIGAVNNIEGTVMMPYDELQGLKNTLTGEESSMQNIINMENGNPLMQGFLQNYQNTYGVSGLYSANTNAGYYGSFGNQYKNADTQSAQTAAYAQNVLNNAKNTQHLIEQLGSNVGKAHGQVAAEQANGQTLVALTEEINQLNKLEAEKVKLAAMQAGSKDSEQEAAAQTIENTTAAQPTAFPASDNPVFGQYPNVTNFGIGK